MNKKRRLFLKQSLVAATALPVWASPFRAAENGDNWAEQNSLVWKGEGKISVFSKNLHFLNYTEMAAAVARIGFDGIDLTVRPNGHVEPARVAEDLPKAVEAIRKAGLEVYMITTAITDPDDPHTEAILRTAGGLGIGYYRLGWLPFVDKISLPQNLEVFKGKLSKLAKLNKKYNIRGDYQNHSGTSLGGSIWDLWLVIKELDPQWIGCQYDIRHATVEGAHSWPNGLRLMQPFIRTLDIKDFHWTQKEGKWQVQNVPLGQGMVDYPKYFSLLNQHQIRGSYSIHYEYPLGGAENGDKTITIGQEEVFAAMKKDLLTLKGWLKENGR
jgi:sugar phosphate isomerase/epimerase